MHPPIPTGPGAGPLTPRRRSSSAYTIVVFLLKLLGLAEIPSGDRALVNVAVYGALLLLGAVALTIHVFNNLTGLLAPVL